MGCVWRLGGGGETNGQREEEEHEEDGECVENESLSQGDKAQAFVIFKAKAIFECRWILNSIASRVLFVSRKIVYTQCNRQT